MQCVGRNAGCNAERSDGQLVIGYRYPTEYKDYTTKFTKINNTITETEAQDKKDLQETIAVKTLTANEVGRRAANIRASMQELADGFAATDVNRAVLGVVVGIGG